MDIDDEPKPKASSELPALMSLEEFDRTHHAIDEQDEAIVEGIKAQVRPPAPPSKLDLERANPLDVIAQYFPHISARIHQFWNSRKNLDDYLNSLVMMGREGRDGFPPEVMNAMLSVWNHHRSTFQRNEQNQCPWTLDPGTQRELKRAEDAGFFRGDLLSGSEAALMDAKLTENSLKKLLKS